MPVYKPRTRTISFRLSEAEYTELKNLSMEQGSRSLSDFARETVRRAMNDESDAPGGIEARVQALRVRTLEIERELARLIRAAGHEIKES